MLCFAFQTDYLLHSAVHASRPDIRCAIYIGCNPVVAVSSLKVGLLPLTNDAAVLGEITSHTYNGGLSESEEKEKLIRSLGPISKVLLLTNHGALCCGETIEEAFYSAYHIVQVCAHFYHQTKAIEWNLYVSLTNSNRMMLSFLCAGV